MHSQYITSVRVPSKPYSALQITGLPTDNLRRRHYLAGVRGNIILMEENDATLAIVQRRVHVYRRG